MRVLVTGGTGFVGPHVVRAIRDEGHEVHALVRNPEGEGSRMLADWGCELVAGDMTNEASLRSAVEGCDVVVNLVAIVKGSDEAFERIMKQGTRSLVAAAKDAGIGRFVHMSALGVGERSKDLTPYFSAKWDQEQAVKESGLEYVIFRPSFVFGPDGGTLQIFMRLVRLAPVVPILGTRKSQPVWADDVGAYFGKAVTEPAAANRTFDLVGADVVTQDELFAAIKRVLSKRRPTFHMPIGLARAAAVVAEKVPVGPPLTRDTLTMLEFEDNVGDAGPAIETFGLEPLGLEAMLRLAAEKKGGAPKGPA
jgi:NADH dehydrogenase